MAGLDEGLDDIANADTAGLDDLAVDAHVRVAAVAQAAVADQLAQRVEVRDRQSPDPAS